jgi:hypothetical protein
MGPGNAENSMRRQAQWINGLAGTAAKHRLPLGFQLAGAGFALFSFMLASWVTLGQQALGINFSDETKCITADWSVRSRLGVGLYLRSAIQRLRNRPRRPSRSRTIAFSTAKGA